MGVVSVTEIWEERAGELSAQPSASSVRSFRVICDSQYDDDQVALAASGIPSVGDVHPNNPGITLQRKRAQHDQGERTWWKVVCEYSSISGQLLPGNENPNPLLRPGVSRWDFEESFEPAVKGYRYNDTTGQFNDFVSGIVSSTGLPFSPPAEARVLRPVLIFTRNEANYPLSLAMTYQNTTNENQFTIFGKTVLEDQALVWSILSSGQQLENGYAFWPVEYTIKFNADKWYISNLDQDTFRWNQTTGKPEEIRFNGRIVTRPVPLNGFGQPLDLSIPPNPADYVYRTYRYYKRTNFAALGIF